jgi:hypothetical protein
MGTFSGLLTAALAVLCVIVVLWRRKREDQPVQLILWTGLPGEEPICGWIANRSPVGLGITVVEEIAEDTVLRVRVATAPHSVPWTQIVVRNCYPLEGKWILNCQFVELPAEEVLMSFR